MFVLGYEKNFTYYDIEAPNEIEAQISMLTGEAHNNVPNSLHIYNHNPSLFELDDLDFIYKVRWIKEQNERII